MTLCIETDTQTKTETKTKTGPFEVRDGFGHSLLELAQQAGLQLNARCGGNGVCDGCAVRLQEGHYLIGDQHVTITRGSRMALACQTRLASESASIRFPRTSLVERQAKIDEHFALEQFSNDIQTRKYCVHVPLPKLEDAKSDWQSIRDELHRQSGVRDYDLPVKVLQQLPDALADGDRTVTVTVGRVDRGWKVIDIEAGDKTQAHYGIAVDIGTTTVVVILVDLNTGHVLKRASLYNQQITKADDVGSRISCCQSRADVNELQRLVIEDTINALIDALCEDQQAPPEAISRIAVSGNTVMTHLFLGVSPAGIGRLPFQPVTNVHQEYRAADLGLRISNEGIVDTVPSIAGYLGGDVVSDIHVARMSKRTEPTLLLDMGTNGEIVYSEDNHFVACATAAGPAFEGYGMAHGCRAAAGAIENIRFGEDLQFDIQTIGNVPSNGICGSGIIDFIACGRRCGLINRMGRLDVEMLRRQGKYHYADHMCGASHACVLVDAERSGTGELLYVSDLDLSVVMKAKAAMFAGMKTLLRTQGKAFDDVRRFCLAGGFARYIDLENAVFIGLLPEIPLDRFEVIGNGSLAGAYLCLVEADARETYQALSRLPEVVELNLVEDFETDFIDALALPNMNDEEFPGVMAALANS